MPWGFREFEAPRFQDNRHMKVVTLSALRTGRLLLLACLLACSLARLPTYSLTYLLTHSLTHSMEQSPFWEASQFAASQEIPHILQNMKVHYGIHKCPPPVRILSQLDVVQTATSHFLEIHLNITLSIYVWVSPFEYIWTFYLITCER
jgi:hypothetical protein